MASLLSNEAVQPDPMLESMPLPPQQPALMPLPPLATYTTEEGLYESIQAWAKQHNYCFRIGRSKAISGSRKKVIFQYSRCGSGLVVNRLQDDSLRPQNRIHSTSTSKTGCQFLVVRVQVNES